VNLEIAALSDVSRSFFKTELLSSVHLPVAVELWVYDTTFRSPSETVLRPSRLLIEPSLIFATSALLIPLTLGIMVELEICSSRLKAAAALTSYLYAQSAMIRRSEKVIGFILNAIPMSGHILTIREGAIILI
jgi:hypothetical protein